MKPPKYCPQCTKELTLQYIKDRDRLACPDREGCGYVNWNNPTPVVAAIVEANDEVILVQSIGWPSHIYALVTGFMEAGEDAVEGVQREVREEIGLEPIETNFIGLYPFHRMNQLIIAYHVKVEDGEITLDETELTDYKRVPIHKMRPWPTGTGYAVNDWLKSRGIEAEFIQFGKRKK